MRCITILLAFVFVSNFVFAGAGTEKKLPVKWTVSVKKTGDKQYQISAKAKMDKGYHIWGLDAGGDGSLIATELKTKDAGIKWADKEWTSSKAPKKEVLEFVDGAVFYFENEVTFTRTFSANAKSISGVITYQSCNESMCFPPEDVPFEVKLEE